MQKWHQPDKMVACRNFRQFRVVEEDLKLFAQPMTKSGCIWFVLKQKLSKSDSNSIQRLVGYGGSQSAT